MVSLASHYLSQRPSKCKPTTWQDYDGSRLYKTRTLGAPTVQRFDRTVWIFGASLGGVLRILEPTVMVLSNSDKMKISSFLAKLSF